MPDQENTAVLTPEQEETLKQIARIIPPNMHIILNYEGEIKILNCDESRQAFLEHLQEEFELMCEMGPDIYFSTTFREIKEDIETVKEKIQFDKLCEPPTPEEQAKPDQAVRPK